jgi:hypothetical protein
VKVLVAILKVAHETLFLDSLGESTFALFYELPEGQISYFL